MRRGLPAGPRLGALLLLAAALSCVQAFAQELQQGLRLSYTLAEPAVASRDEAAAARASATDERLARLLAQPQGCDDIAAGQVRGPLRIGDVVHAVICRFVGVRRGEGLAERAQGALDQARSQRQPTLSWSAGMDAELNNSAGWATTLRLEWVLFDFGRRHAGLQQARQALAAVLDEQRVEVLTALGNGAQLYAAAQAAFGRLGAAAINLRTAEDSARVADARHGAGAGTLAEKLQAETALAQAKLEHTRSMSQWLSARGELALAMGLPSSEPLEFAPIDSDNGLSLDSALDIRALVDEARSAHPRVSAARARLAEAQQRASAVKAERWGSITLNASTGRNRPSSDSDFRGRTSAAVQWSVPLFDRGSLEARQRDAQGQILVSSADLDDALRQVELQVWQQGQALAGERDGLRQSRSVLENAESALRVAAERYRQGVGGFNDVLTAQNAAANARFQWVEAQANLRRAQLRLAASVGRFGPLVRF